MSSIILVGLNHRTAPIVVREQLALAHCGLNMALQEMQQNQIGQLAHESFILSTCNRLEVYARVDDPAAGAEAVMGFLARLQNIDPSRLRPHLYVLAGEAAVSHLLRVAAGLDSMVLGEPQILGQVAAAGVTAQKEGATGLVLGQLVNQAIRAGKRARTETAISRHTTSVSHAAVQFISDHLHDLEQRRILIVGAGEMAEMAAKALHYHGVTSLHFINRTYSGAEDIAQRFNGRAWAWGQLADALVEADVVIAATGAPHLVIYAGDVAAVLPQRAGRPLLLVDIALPRNIEGSAQELAGVTGCNLDQLQSTVDLNLGQRQAAVPQVEQIIRQETAAFMEWWHGRQVVPVLVDLRQKAQTVAANELEIALRRLNGLGAQEQEVVTVMVQRIVNKLLHEPTVRLKAEAANGNGHEYARAIRDLFALPTAAMGQEPAGAQPSAAEKGSHDHA
jgi:glutamyl-tRNA reductase